MLSFRSLSLTLHTHTAPPPTIMKNYQTLTALCDDDNGKVVDKIFAIKQEWNNANNRNTRESFHLKVFSSRYVRVFFLTLLHLHLSISLLFSHSSLCGVKLVAHYPRGLFIKHHFAKCFYTIHIFHPWMVIKWKKANTHTQWRQRQQPIQFQRIPNKNWMAWLRCLKTSMMVCRDFGIWFSSSEMSNTVHFKSIKIVFLCVSVWICVCVI